MEILLHRKTRELLWWCTYLTDTPVCELLASGRTKEASPSQSSSWILALDNAFIPDFLYEQCGTTVLRFGRAEVYIGCKGTTFFAIMAPFSSKSLFYIM